MARRTHKWAILLLCLAWFSVCSQHPQALPEPYYAAVRLKFQRGDLLVAQEEANQAYGQFAKTSPDWAVRFRVLQAEILVWRGMSKEALALLDSELPIHCPRMRQPFSPRLHTGWRIPSYTNFLLPHF